MNHTNEPANSNEQPTASRKRQRVLRSAMTTRQIQREIVLKEAARRRQDLEIEELKLALIKNAREQKAQSGLRAIVKTLEQLQPADVATFLMMLGPFVGKEEELQNIYTWQEMHAELAASAVLPLPADVGEAV